MRTDASEPGRLYPALGQLAGVPVCAADRKVGTVSTFLLDSDAWAVRWLALDTGGWLSSRVVLVGADRLGRFDWAFTAGALRIDLPSAELAGAAAFDAAQTRPLWRAEEVAGAAVGATDGDVGVVRDLLLDDVAWTLRFLQCEIDGRFVLVPSAWVDAIDPDARTVRLGVDRRLVAAAPDWDGSASPGPNLG